MITQQELEQSGVSKQLDSYGDEPVVFAMGAGEDNFSVEASGPAGDSDVEGTDIMTTLPSEAWFAFGAPDVGGRIAETYQQFVDAFETGLESGIGDVQDSLDAQGLKPTDIPEIDVEIEKRLGLDITKDLGWIGNVGGFVQGASIFDLGGGIVIETDDPDAAAAALAKLRAALGRDRSLKITETEDGGFNIQTLDAPVGAEVGIRDDKVVFAFAGATIDDVLEPSKTLSDSDTFSSADSALGDDLDPSFYLDLAPILALVEKLGRGLGPRLRDGRSLPVRDRLHDRRRRGQRRPRHRPVRDRRPGAGGHLVGLLRRGNHPVAMPERAPRPGVDLIEIERIERALDRRPRLAGRLFTDAEVAYAEARARPARHLAARFAAKEAAIKALGKRLPPREIEVVNCGRSGNPPSTCTATPPAKRSASRSP